MLRDRILPQSEVIRAICWSIVHVARSRTAAIVSRRDRSWSCRLPSGSSAVPARSSASITETSTNESVLATAPTWSDQLAAAPAHGGSGSPPTGPPHKRCACAAGADLHVLLGRCRVLRRGRLESRRISPVSSRSLPAAKHASFKNITTKPQLALHRPMCTKPN